MIVVEDTNEDKKKEEKLRSRHCQLSHDNIQSPDLLKCQFTALSFSFIIGVVKHAIYKDKKRRALLALLC